MAITGGSPPAPILPGEVKTEIGPFHLFPVTGPQKTSSDWCFAVGEIMGSNGSIECLAFEFANWVYVHALH